MTVYAVGDPSTPVIDVPLEVAAGGAYTIAAVGLVADGYSTAQVQEEDLGAPSAGSAKVRVVHASPDAGPVDVVPRGSDPLVEGLAFPDATPYAEVPAGTYSLDLDPTGSEDAVLRVPDAALTVGGVYSAFAVGTVYADGLQILLVQDNAAGGATASASASASATASAAASATAEPPPGTGGTSLALPAALALMVSGRVASPPLGRVENLLLGVTASHHREAEALCQLRPSLLLTLIQLSTCTHQLMLEQEAALTAALVY